MQGDTRGTGQGRWLVITGELVTAHTDDVRAIAQAREDAEQLGCDVIVLDRHDGRTVLVAPDGSTDTPAQRSIRARVQARRAAKSAGVRS